MPSTTRHLTAEMVAAHVRDHVFDTASSPDPDHVARSGFGVELEWITSKGPSGRRITVDDAHELMDEVCPLPGGSRLTLEPGGQLELSSARADGVAEALRAAALDLFVVDRACSRRDVALIALGADPLRAPERILPEPRYAAMETYFDGDGASGRTMMSNTASIQVNVGLGPAEHVARRWRLANAICPTLIACFANSPFADGGPSGWQSTRQRAWTMVDPTRTAALDHRADPVATWVAYALDARVMLVHVDDTDQRPVTGRLTFGQWLHDGHELGWPTLEDFTYHLTTLFPPVRPRGWFELRVLDTLPTPFWQVAALLVHTVLTDPAVHDDATRAVAGTEHLWIDAAQLGLAHPALADSARALFSVALEALAPTSPANPMFDVFATYFGRWVTQGRSPGDDRLDAWRRTGQLVPPRESPVPYADELGLEPLTKVRR